MRLSDLRIPTTDTSDRARTVLVRYSSPALVNHCVRSYLWAAALAELENVPVDHELLWVAALLHDLGLERPFDSHHLPFEQAGGHVAAVFAAGAGWDRSRQDRLREVIVAHMVGTDPAVDPEGHLLDLATGLDISGRHPERWPTSLLREVVAAHPRLDLAGRFTVCFRDQAERKPDSAAAKAVAAGVAERLASNPLESIDPGTS